MILGEEKIIENFKFIFEITSSKEFLQMEGLSGEIPFWIAPYDIQYQSFAAEQFQHLINKLKHKGIDVLILDLFELSIEIIEGNIGLKKMFQVEKRKDKNKFKKALQSTLNLHERFIPLIIKKVDEAKPKILM